MVFASMKRGRRPLGIVFAVYAVAIGLAALAAAAGAHRLGTALLTAASGAKGPIPAHDAARQHRSSVPGGLLMLTNDRWDGRRWDRPYARERWRRAAPQSFFGPWSPRAPRWEYDDREDRGAWDEEAEDRRSYGTYRTLCVRLCDGFYFPVSFAVRRERFAHDDSVCRRRCGSEARLFVHRNPGEDVEDMRDLSGRPYKNLSSAFLYRTSYQPSCKCQPDPWEPEARDRHRVYALEAARRKGSKEAARELKTLKESQRSSAQATDNRARATRGYRSGDGLPADARAGERPSAMGLGASRSSPAPERKSTPEAARGERDWRSTVFKPVP